MQTQFTRYPETRQNIVRELPAVLTRPVGNDAASIVVRNPTIEDGARIWRIAANSRVLDVNSSYAYVLWCRDFAQTSVVAEIDGEVGGFVIGYLRPEQPGTLFVWQVAVDHASRGRRVGVGMLDCLLSDLAERGISTLETTIAPENAASIAMFGALARSRGMHMTRQPLFTPGHFPDSHEPEQLYRITAATHQKGR
ncbi:diaminobutyrate acetyltransferase [Nocardia huaxiensis]|uniref:diaminobutyrate acetyltransferase n=1 Tax=Nocardia huaxiensis TaxID=2755382 RepID=UPI001E5382A5|nr:diaminobutyrate acetyltransferase [Nocardia huaxiensis]UFS97077.1 diaminobutyrate acetyltransferase [Nocardia huaxiensis]